jgi:hypothetical protein
LFISQILTGSGNAPMKIIAVAYPVDGAPADLMADFA